MLYWKRTHAGAIVHVSDYLARPRVGLFSIDPSEEVAELLRPLRIAHRFATKRRDCRTVLDDILLSKPDAIFVTDVSASLTKRNWSVGSQMRHSNSQGPQLR